MFKLVALSSVFALSLGACGGDDDDDDDDVFDSPTTNDSSGGSDSSSPDAGGPDAIPVEMTACGADVDLQNDATVNIRWTYTYDQNGYPSVDDMDDGVDGSIDLRVVYSY